MARPSEYTEEVAEQICEGIAEGKSIRAVCNQDGMPHVATVFRWLSSVEAFREQYTRARQTRADARFERIDDVMADMRAGTIDAQQARVEIDAIKWQCGKEAGKYDDKMKHEHTGEGGGPLTVQIVRFGDDQTSGE